jgi:hypothetical protein
MLKCDNYYNLVQIQKYNVCSNFAFRIRRSSNVVINKTWRWRIFITHSNIKQNVQGNFYVIQIAVDYYINCDLAKANFFQKKLNNLSVKSLSSVSV